MIISTDRAKRPTDFLPRERADQRDRILPVLLRATKAKRRRKFSRTAATAAVQRTRRAGRVRVVPNKFPALGIEGGLDREGEGLFDRMNGDWRARSDHRNARSHATPSRPCLEKAIEDVLWAFRDRMLDLKNDRRFRYILLFKNHGEAGRRLAGTYPLAIDRAADRSQARPRRSG